MASPPDSDRAASAARPLPGEALTPPPIWLMRQAGRYLPEYRAVRAKAGGFLDLCYTPALAAEVTLQPIRRYGFDAAILFSDILVVPDALGQKVEFVEGEGPRLEPVRSAADLARLNASATRRQVRARLRNGRAGCGRICPMRRPSSAFAARRGRWRPTWWAGRARPTRREARLWAYRDPRGFRRLIDLLVEASVEYLSVQVEAGADVLQIFDTWAGSLPPRRVRALGGRSRPRRIVSAVRGETPAGADHRLSARRGAEDRALRRRRRACRAWAATPAWTSEHMAEPGRIDRRGRAGQSRSAAAGCRRTRRWSGRSRHSEGAGGRAAYLQPRPRHRAGDAAGARGAACGTLRARAERNAVRVAIPGTSPRYDWACCFG